MKAIIKTKIGTDRRVASIKKAVANELDDLKIKRVNDPGQADLAIIIGGDGTLLYWQSQLSCPLVGINGSGIGYYMGVSEEDFLGKIKKIIEGKEGIDYNIRKLSRLQASINGKLLPPALNEYLISSKYTRKIFECKLKVGEKDTIERGTGVICYTPTGSGALARSAGAGKLEWTDSRIGIIALAPYGGELKNGGMLVSGGEIIIECISDKGEVCVDGQEKYSYGIKKGDIVLIKKSTTDKKIIKVIDIDKK